LEGEEDKTEWVAYLVESKRSNADREGPTGEWGGGEREEEKRIGQGRRKVETEENRSNIKGKSLDHGKTG
jgi:hypothetical protein